MYGSPAVYDVVREYGLSPEVAAKVGYTGYLDRRVAPSPTPLARDEDGDDDGRGWPGGEGPAAAAPSSRRGPARHEPFVLCMVGGGGEDGAALGDAFADSDATGRDDVKAARLTARLARGVDFIIAIATAGVLYYGTLLALRRAITPALLSLYPSGFSFAIGSVPHSGHRSGLARRS